MATLNRFLSKLVVAGLAAAGATGASAALTGAVSSSGTLCLGSTPTTPTTAQCTEQTASTLTYLDFINGGYAPQGLTPTPGSPGIMFFNTATGDLTPLIGQQGLMYDITLPGLNEPDSDFDPMTLTWRATGTNGAEYTFALTHISDIDRENVMDGVTQLSTLDVYGHGNLCRNAADCNLFSFVFTTQTTPGAVRSSWSLSQSGFGKVPEPGSLALLGLGLVGLAAGARRRRQD